MDTSKSPKRHHLSRTEVKWQVHFFTPHGEIKGETVNISLEGVMVSCQDLPPLEDNFRLVLKPPDHHPLNITGKVVWTTICNPVSGANSIGVDIQFVSISDKDRLYLQSIITDQVDHHVGYIAPNLPPVWCPMLKVKPERLRYLPLPMFACRFSTTRAEKQLRQLVVAFQPKVVISMLNLRPQKVRCFPSRWKIPGPENPSK